MPLIALGRDEEIDMTKKSCFFGADWLRLLDPGWLLLDLFAANERDELRILVFHDSCAYLGYG